MLQETPRETPITPKRLAYLVSHGASYASNGYAIRTHGIACALQQAGLEVLCFVRPGRPWDFGAAHDAVPLEVVKDGIRYIHSRWPAGKPESSEQATAMSAEIYAELFAVYKPDLVLAASNYEVGLPAVLSARAAGLPVAYEIRGFWEISRSSREPEFADTPDYQQQVLAESWLASLPVPLFTLNEAMRQELIRRGAAPQRVALVPNGITRLPAQSAADPAIAGRLGLQDGDYVFGYVGSLLAYEGLDDLIRALAALPAASRWKLLLVGEQHPFNVARSQQQPGFASVLLELAQSLGVAERLCFTGRVPHAEVGQYYALIDTVVLPRKDWPVCQLVMPLKGIEALSFGMQLLVSDVAPLKELQQLSATVRVFRAGDEADLQHQLQNLLDQRLTPAHREQIRQQVWQHHNYSQVIRPLLQWSQDCTSR